MCQVRAPRHPVPLDAVLGNQDFVPGFKPRIGGRHIRVIALAGFPAFSHAELARGSGGVAAGLPLVTAGAGDRRARPR